MKRWIAIALLAAGCYRGAPPEAPAPARPLAREQEPPARPRPARPRAPERGVMTDALAKLGELTDDMCACTDRTCADAVMQEITRWSTEMSKEYQDLKPTDEEALEATRVTERLSKCMMAAMSAGVPLTPPPPPPPPAP